MVPNLPIVQCKGVATSFEAFVDTVSLHDKAKLGSCATMLDHKATSAEDANVLEISGGGRQKQTRNYNHVEVDKHMSGKHNASTYKDHG